MRLPISVIIPVKNEATNIRRCLDSVQWAEEIVIIDSESTDNTAAICSEFDNTKIISTPWLGYAETKILGLKHTKFDWILWLDADEVISTNLQNNIATLFTTQNLSCAAYKLARKNWFVTKFVMHGGWYPDLVTRFFNKNQAGFNNNILHEGISVPNNGAIGKIDGDILHYSYPTLTKYFEKLLVYGPLGAEEALRKGKTFLITDITLRPMVTFIKMYFAKKGFLDGVPGLILALGSAFSTFVRYANLYYYCKKKN